VEFGETVEQALKREFKEELSITKLTVKNPVFMNDTIYPDAKRHIINLYFRVTMKKGLKIGVNPERVLKGAAFVDMKKFQKLLFYPDIKNAIITAWKKGFKESLGYIRVKFRS
jgi:8-oxo-dGTP diphosphatase